MASAILIAVRLKSSRLKHKALLPISRNESQDISLIECLISRLKLSTEADEIVLCTSTDPEDNPLVEIANRSFIKCFRGDPHDVMSRFISAAKLYNIDTIIRVTGDNPFIDPIFVDELLVEYRESPHDVLKIDTLPLGMGIECFSLSTLEKAYQLALDPSQSEYMTAYLFRSGYFNVSRFIPRNFPDNYSHIRLTVDYFEDLQLCTIICRLLRTHLFSFHSLLELFTLYPALFSINADVKMIPLPRIRFSDQPDQSEYPKAYLLLDQPYAFNYQLLNDWLKSNHYYIEGIYVHSDSCSYTMHDDLPILGTVSAIPSHPSNVKNLIIHPKLIDLIDPRLLAFNQIILPNTFLN